MGTIKKEPRESEWIKKTDKEKRQIRLATSLRQNLEKRKDQVRRRKIKLKPEPRS